MLCNISYEWMETDKINGRLPMDRSPVIPAIINNITMKYTAMGSARARGSC